MGTCDGHESFKQWSSVFVFITSIAALGHGLSLRQCQSNFIDVDMDSSNNEVTCEGAEGTEKVEWKYTDGGDNTGSISCPPSGPCTSNALFSATRTAGSTSSRLTFKQDVKRFRALYGSFNLTCLTSYPVVSGVVTGQVSCRIDVVHRTEVTSCSAQFNTAADTSWTVSGSCVVSKTFSQRDRYSCQWRENKSGTGVDIPSTLNPTGSFDEGGITYKRMTCDFNKSFPKQTGSYSYTAVISPGAVQPDVTFTGSSDLVLPSASTTCPTDYVIEGDTVDCTCTSNNGNPSGSAVWRIPQGPSRLVLSDVRRGNHSNPYVCEVKWGDRVVRSTTFTLQVAYGPESVRINGPQQPFDTDGTKDMSFTCTANNFRPDVSYQWRRLPNGSSSNGHSYTVQNVGAADDGAVFQCTASNTKFSSSLRASRSVTLDLHYPPTDPPVIHSSSSESFVYQGDPLTLTCSVRGGKPVTETSVTFDCPNKPDMTDVEGTTEVSSSLVFDPVAVSDNGRVCTCRPQWKTYDWYTPQKQTTVTVYYSPPPPDINPGNQPYPFMAGDSPTLYCNYPATTDPGNPTATLTLEGQTGSAGQGEVSVTLTQLTSADNGRTVVCTASNAFTVHNNTPVTQRLQLQVYYRPVIRFTSLPSDTCSLSSSVCVVEEGQRVRVNCTAHSNPAIDTVAWQPGASSVLDLQADRDMGMNYTCDVSTINGDSRLPLHNSQQIEILVKYQAEVTTLTVNNAHNTTTVNESDSVSVTCTASGRPTAGIVLTRDGETVNSRPQGEVTRDDVATLTSVTSRARCEDAGRYACQVHNDVGEPDLQSVTVFVNCKPRLSHPAEVPDSFNYLGEPLTVTFPLTTFPAPQMNTLTFTGRMTNSSDEEVRPAREDMFSIYCPPTGNTPLAFTNCTLTINNVTERDKGFYNVTFRNGWGKAVFRFQLDVNGTKSGSPGESTGFPVGAAVGGGIAAALAVVAVVAVIIIVVRRKGAGRKDSQKRNTRAQHGRVNRANEEPEMIQNCIYGTSGNQDDEEETTIVNTMYESSASAARPKNTNGVPQGSAYEDVDFSGTTPAIKPTPQADDQLTAASDTYATVTKEKNSPPPGGSSVTENSNVYASVNKSKKKPALPVPAKPGFHQDEAKPGVKPKPDKKPKPEKNKDKGKGKKKTDEKEPLKPVEDPSAVYSNMTPLSMNPAPAHGTVYENYTFQKENEDHTNHTHGVEQDDTRTTNPDGLLYTTIAFSDKQQKKAQLPPPERETTEYVDIDFTKLAPQSKE